VGRRFGEMMHGIWLGFGDVGGDVIGAAGHHADDLAKFGLEIPGNLGNRWKSWKKIEKAGKYRNWKFLTS